MIDPKKFQILAESAKEYGTEVLLLADATGNASVTLVEVMQDFLKTVSHPFIAGGFAMAHHGFIRGTVDIDVIAIDSVRNEIQQFEKMGYKRESLRIPIGSIELLSKSNKGVDFLHIDNEDFLASIQQRAVAGVLLTQAVRMVSIEDLILLKLLALRGRKNRKDEIDIEYLLEQTYDQQYVDTWRNHLHLADGKK